MRCLWVVFISTLCACAHAKMNPIDLGHVQVHAQSGVMSLTYPPHVNDTVATRNLRMILEKLRPYFPTGLGHIPILDPYHRGEPIVVNVDSSDFDCKITLSNINVYGAQHFALAASQVYLATHRIDFKVDFGELYVSLNYRVALHSDEAWTMFDGQLNMTLKQVVADMAIQLKILLSNHPPLDTFFSVDGMNLNTTIDNLQYDLATLARSRRSVPASKLTLNIVQDLKDDIALAVVEAMMKDLYQVLSNYTVKQINHMLLPLQ